MSNAEHVIESLILGMRDGYSIDELMENDISIKENLEDEDCNMSADEAVQIACLVVDKLYEGHYPIDHLDVGDICMDAFGCNPCIITNVGKSIHVLYFNGKTHKFPGTQERFFKKTGINIYNLLQAMMNMSIDKYERYIDLINGNGETEEDDYHEEEEA